MPRLTTAGLAIIATLSAVRAEAQLGARAQPLLPADAAAAQIAALQQQVAALQAAVQALQVKTQYVVVDNYGNYALKVPRTINITAGDPNTPGDLIVHVTNVDMWANSNMSLRGGVYAMLRGEVSATIRGAAVQINPNSTRNSAAAIVGSMIAPQTTAGTPQTVLTGSSTVTIGN
jgi:hypothetical protein